MIEQIKSSEIKKFIEKNPKTVLLDVRTEDEWNTVGKPTSDSLGIKTFFITINYEESIFCIIKSIFAKRMRRISRITGRFSWGSI